MYVIWFIIDNKSDNCMIESLIVGSANALLMIKLCMIEMKEKDRDINMYSRGLGHVRSYV